MTNQSPFEAQPPHTSDALGPDQGNLERTPADPPERAVDPAALLRGFGARFLAESVKADGPGLDNENTPGSELAVIDPSFWHRRRGRLLLSASAVVLAAATSVLLFGRTSGPDEAAHHAAAPGQTTSSSATGAPETKNGSCTNSVSCWPNATDTGYENAPGYPGTHGVLDQAKLTPASANNSKCPTTFESDHTYSNCVFSGSTFIGSNGNLLTNVHFVGDVFQDTNQTGDPDKDAVMVFCKNDCTFNYVTIKPETLTKPDLPGHGTSYKNSYGVAMGAGFGDYGTVGHGVQVTNSDIWGFGSGIILGDNTAETPILIQNNWLHDQAVCNGDCAYHTDGIGMVNTGDSSSYVTINHNNMPFVEDNTNDIAFQQGTYNHLTITNNILSGDGYTVAIWGTSSYIKFTGNVWTNYGQQYYGVNYGQDFWDTPGSTWKDNKFLWDPSGVNPFYESGPGSGNTGEITSTDSGKCWVPNGLSSTDYHGGSC